MVTEYCDRCGKKIRSNCRDEASNVSVMVSARYEFNFYGCERCGDLAGEYIVCGECGEKIIDFLKDPTRMREIGGKVNG